MVQIINKIVKLNGGSFFTERLVCRRIPDIQYARGATVAPKFDGLVLHVSGSLDDTADESSVEGFFPVQVEKC